MNIQLKNREWFALGIIFIVFIGMFGYYLYHYAREMARLEELAKATQIASPVYSLTDEQKATINQANEIQQRIAEIQAARLNATTTTGTDAIGSYIEKNFVKDYSQSISNLNIAWLAKPLVYTDQQAVNLLEKSVANYSDILAKLSKNCCTGDSCVYNGPQSRCGKIIVMELGTILSPSVLKNKTVYFLSFPVYYSGLDGEDGGKLALFDENSQKFIQLTNSVDSLFTTEPIRFAEGLSFSVYSGGNIQSPELNDHRWFSGAINYSYIFGNFLNFPAVLEVPGKDIKLVYLNKTDCGAFSSGSSCGLGGFDSNGENIFDKFSHQNLLYRGDSLGSIYFTTSCFKFVLPNGSIGNYQIAPNFFNNVKKADQGISYNVDINWNRSANSKDKYQLISTGRCGILGCENIVSNDWFSEEKLLQIGTAVNGDKIYELSDKATNSYYRQIFDTVSYYWPEDGYQVSATATPDEIQTRNDLLFKKFISDEPLFFWKDQLGNWRVYQKSKYVPGVECGKPVIYLYPEKDTRVNVKVEPNGGLSKVEPEYPANGWTVNATPKSELTNLADGNKYPYLFWEGKAYNMITPDYGFVLKRSEVGDKMKLILEKLGLNAKETTDFLEFWQPKLEVKPYVFVTFVPQSEFDKLAPLTVTPKPDKVIRVFMDYYTLNEPIRVVEPRIVTPIRTGFTVVEWGGRLR